MALKGGNPSSSLEHQTRLDDVNSTGDSSLLNILPNELIANILAVLYYRDLASCSQVRLRAYYPTVTTSLVRSQQVCKRMVEIIRSSALLQYHLELGRCGMEDNPLCSLPIPERREQLQAYDDAWQGLRWSSCVNVLNVHDNTHGMDISPGGILTFVSWVEGKILFVQLPSNLRGIPMRQWELSFSFVPHACALDPSEDILVVWQRDE